VYETTGIVMDNVINLVKIKKIKEFLELTSFRRESAEFRQGCLQKCGTVILLGGE
jgi:hypothetical protein